MFQINHNNLHLNYFGGSGGFLALHLLLLSHHYCNDLNNQLDTVLAHQWNISDHSKWKYNETWPDNNKTFSMPGSPKLFFYCNHPVLQWAQLSGIKLLVYTDLASQLALSNYKKSWMHQTDITPSERDLNFHFELFYNAVKDISWPECNSINNSKNLPEHIQQELLSHNDYLDFLKATSWSQWFIVKNQANTINNDIVYSEAAAAAKHSNIVVKLQDIVNTDGAALLTPLGLAVNDQHIGLIQRWKSLHSNEILAMMARPVDSSQIIS